jgi:integrase
MKYPLSLPSPAVVYPHVDEAEAKAIWLEAKTQRYRVFIKTLWFTGLRLAEVLSLKAGDLTRQGLNFSLKIVRVKRKKPMPENLPIPRELGLDIADYIQAADLKPSAKLFPGHRTTYQYQVKVCAKRAGLPNASRIHSHSFRHGFVYHKASQGIHPYILTKLVGHSSLPMTLQYYQPTEDDLRRAMEA